MPLQRLRFLFIGALSTGGLLGHFVSLPLLAQAQIVPDATLGRERSILRTNIPGVHGLIDRIDGGAQRGGNLFHSFLDFNINRGQQVYFANPISINNIISRVTGRDFSSIDGTLGVLGRANLFLINPNGIVFGANARLDIRGSFVASTADKIPFADGYTFNATSPETEPLLTVSSPLGLASWQVNQGTISNLGSLSVGQDLSLLAANLNLQRELKAAGDLNLLATNTLTAQDTPSQSFIASAGKQLIVQGNQSVDITALNRPASGLFSGGDMVLQSDGPIVTDTRFTAGGNFRAERLDGSLGSVISIQDPVFETGGDFAIADYTGASLQILAGGSVTIPGTITITGAGGSSNDGTVTLSDGTSLAITGSTQPTVDIRAGTTQFFGAPAPGTPTSANITIGSIVNPSGLVFLTNQYQPNPALSGDISVGSIDTTADPATGLSGGSVAIDSWGKLTFNNINASGGMILTFPGTNLPDFSTLAIGGDGGNVTLLARGEISMPFPSTIYAYGLQGGNITLKSDTAITQAGTTFGVDPFSLSWIETDTFASDRGGTMRLTAPSIFIGGNVYSTIEGPGQGGDLIISANSLTTDQATIATQTYGPGNAGNTRVVIANALSLGAFSTLGSATFSGFGGNSGNVQVEAGSISAVGGAQITSAAFGLGSAGNIDISAQDITLKGFLAQNVAGEYANGSYIPTAISSTAQPGAEGNSGNVNIRTGTLSITDGAAIFTQSLGVGNSGNININASSLIAVDGAVFLDSFGTQPSAISSELAAGATGKGGNIFITTPVLNVTNGGTVSAVSDGAGDAGSITIDATESVAVDGVVSFANVGQRDRPSQIAVLTAENATGNGGSLTLTTPSLSLTNSGQLTAETLGVGNAGNLLVNVGNSLEIDGSGSGILAGTSRGSTGQGGSIFVSHPDKLTIRDNGRIGAETLGVGAGGSIDLQARSLQVENGGQITAKTKGPGNAGNVVLTISDKLTLQGFGSGILANTGPNSTGNGGDISVFSLNALNIENGARLAVDSQGEGAGGDITVRTRSIDLNNAGVITAETASTKGGNVSIFASDPLNMTNNSRISTTAGTAKAGGDGGNIVIKAPFLISGSNDNSDITANAYSGRGGRVDITTNGILGMTVRSRSDLESALGTSDPNRLDPALLPSSDITAISQTNPNLNGVVDIRSFDSDPFQNVYILPSTTVDVAKLVARGCSTGSNVAKSKSLGTLVVTDRGGLPPSPTDQLDANGLLLGWESSRPESLQSVRPPQGAPEPVAQTTAQQVVEAQAFAIGPSGQVTLVARANDAEPTALSDPPQLCSANE
jgi:filamentous hemagglutinin family protein